MKTESSTLQEIISQPEVWQSTLNSFESCRLDLDIFLGQIEFDKIVVIGCGSTYYLSQTASAILTRNSGLSARAIPSSELWFYPEQYLSPKTLLLTISRSGTTTETSRAANKFREYTNGKVLAITCYPESQLAKQADFVLTAPAAQEESVAQTRSFTSMLLLVQALSASLGLDNAKLARQKELPNKLKMLVEKTGQLSHILGGDHSIERIYFLGCGPLYGIANEAMLKTKEMSLTISEAYHPLEFRHGPMSMVNNQTLIVGLLSDTCVQEEINVLQDMQKLGGRILALVENDSCFVDWLPDHLIELNSGMDEWDRVALYLPLLQQLAYQRAISKKLNPDQPLNLTAVIEL